MPKRPTRTLDCLADTPSHKFHPSQLIFVRVIISPNSVLVRQFSKNKKTLLSWQRQQVVRSFWTLCRCYPSPRTSPKFHEGETLSGPTLGGCYPPRTNTHFQGIPLAIENEKHQLTPEDVPQKQLALVQRNKGWLGRTHIWMHAGEWKFDKRGFCLVLLPSRVTGTAD